MKSNLIQDSALFSLFDHIKLVCLFPNSIYQAIAYFVMIYVVTENKRADICNVIFFM